MIKSIKAWSYSRWSTFTQCPRKAKYLYIDKMYDPGSTAMDRGKTIHKILEDYLKTGGEVPDALKLIASEVIAARERDALSELELAFFRGWEKCSWFDQACWCRVKIDVAVFSKEGEKATIIDLKTGKNKDYSKQLELYALAALKGWPEIKEVTVGLWYSDSGDVLYKEFERGADEERLTKYWEAEAAKLENEELFPTKTSPLCGWCHFRKGNKGVCENG